MLSVHSAAQEIKHYESLPVILLNLKSPILRGTLSLPPGALKQSCSALQNSLGGPAGYTQSTVL